MDLVAAMVAIIGLAVIASVINTWTRCRYDYKVTVLHYKMDMESLKKGEFPNLPEDKVEEDRKDSLC